MGGIPSQSELEERQKQAHNKLLQLKEAYNNFVYFWEKMQNEEKQLLGEVQEHVDAEKLKSILKNIEESNN